MFTRKWQPATATIVLVHIKRMSSDGLTPTRQWAADVNDGVGPMRRVKIEEPRWVTDFWPPDAGASVAVKVDPKSGSVRFDLDDPQLSVKGRDRLAAEAFAAALAEPDAS